MIKRFLLVALGSVLFHGMGIAEAADKSSASKPNVVFILADDIGYGDFGCYGATKVKTPNLDHLASQGIRFTDAHSAAATCTPTRYALMTGQYAFRNPLGSHILPGDAPLSIKPGTYTLPACFKKCGYKTAAIGKWHLGLGRESAMQDWNGEVKPGPLEIGFDHCFLLPATGDRVPCVYLQDHNVLNLDPRDPIKVDYEHAIAGHANEVMGIGRIGSMSGGKSALWKDDEIAKTITGRALKFIEENKGTPFFLYFATHDIHVPRVPAKQFRGSSGAGIRGDAIQEFDWSVGEILKTLERLKIAENTLIIVTSDNGGILDWGDTAERDGNEKSNNGHAFNGPLRGTKGSPYEGGTRVPFIARWPGKIKAGSSSDELICLIDMLSTTSTILGTPLPDDAGPDSFNFLPALLGNKTKAPIRQTLIEDSRRKSLRQGQWKYIMANGKNAKQKEEEELYNLADDLGEKHNLSKTNPEKANELAALLQKAMQQSRTRP
ncbi:MAG: arylsulfatase [Verrucomicrobiales bacterium]|nr:arylsulfatase [Verrucomicrobiales bacterium]